VRSDAWRLAGGETGLGEFEVVLRVIVIDGGNEDENENENENEQETE